MWLYTCSRRHRIEVMQGASTFRRKLMGLPANPLLTAIPHDARDSWRSRPTPELVRRLEILCASGPRPAERVQAVRLMYDRAVRAAWETYVFCAFACGLFEGQRGKELRGRFGSRSDDDFRSAMAECQACWFLAGRLGFPVSGKAPGRGNKMLDMKAVIDDQDVGVEVKAPYREPPPAGQAWSDHDGEALAQCLDAANKQFANDVPNILVLSPQLRTPVSILRTQLVSALYGQEKITCPIDTRTGGRAGPVSTEFSPDGRLLRRRQLTGAPVKRDGTPGFTRVSAVIVIEEQLRQKYPHPSMAVGNSAVTAEVEIAWQKQEALYWARENECWVDHNVLVAHNPHAPYPLDPERFSSFVQFTDIGEGYGWSDGERL